MTTLRHLWDRPASDDGLACADDHAVGHVVLNAPRAFQTFRGVSVCDTEAPPVPTYARMPFTGLVVGGVDTLQGPCSGPQHIMYKDASMWGLYQLTLILVDTPSARASVLCCGI